MNNLQERVNPRKWHPDESLFISITHQQPSTHDPKLKLMLKLKNNYGLISNFKASFPQIPRMPYLPWCSMNDVCSNRMLTLTNPHRILCTWIQPPDMQTIRNFDISVTWEGGSTKFENEIQSMENDNQIHKIHVSSFAHIPPQIVRAQRLQEYMAVNLEPTQISQTTQGHYLIKLCISALVKSNDLLLTNTIWFQDYLSYHLINPRKPDLMMPSIRNYPQWWNTDLSLMEHWMVHLNDLQQLTQVSPVSQTTPKWKIALWMPRIKKK